MVGGRSVRYCYQGPTPSSSVRHQLLNHSTKSTPSYTMVDIRVDITMPSPRSFHRTYFHPIVDVWILMERNRMMAFEIWLYV